MSTPSCPFAVFPLLGDVGDAGSEAHHVLGREEFYEIDWSKPLGVGMHGPVYRATNRKTGEGVAMKTLSMRDCKSPDDYASLMNELEIMSKLDHPNIAKLVEVFSSKAELHLMIEVSDTRRTHSLTAFITNHTCAYLHTWPPVSGYSYAREGSYWIE